MQNKTILIVDDSRVVLQMERMILRSKRIRCIVAKDGEEAVEVARRDLPDLILLDVMMPRMNGFEAAELLLEDLATKHIPIIMVTTHAEEECIERAMTLGCSDYVYKPIDPAELIAKVENLLDLE